MLPSCVCATSSLNVREKVVCVGPCSTRSAIVWTSPRDDEWIHKFLDSQFSSTVFYSHIISTFPKRTAYASVETRGEICLRRYRFTKHGALDHPRTFRCPYITRNTSLRCVRLSLETSRTARSVPNSSCRMDYEPRPASPASTHATTCRYNVTLRHATSRNSRTRVRLLAAWSPEAGLEPDDCTERSDVGRRNWVRCTLVDAAVRLYQVGADVQARC